MFGKLQAVGVTFSAHTGQHQIFYKRVQRETKNKMATVVIEKKVVAGQDDKDDVDVGALRVVSACCCAFTSLYTATPNCIGMQSSARILCINGDCRMCKPATNHEGQDEKKVWCILMDSDCVCAPPTTCIGGQTQICCLDSRCGMLLLTFP